MTRLRILKPVMTFPENGFLRREICDFFRIVFFDPVFSAIYTFCLKLRHIQHGSLQIYILYIAVTLFILLIWKLF